MSQPSPFPLITVVIPLYNSAQWIRQSLASVLAQTYTHFELIVVDDGSTDDGPEIVRACRDRRVRLISQPNRGLAGARNTGIRNASGRFVAFLDADDLWDNEKLARHIAHFARCPEVGVSFSWSAMIDEAGNPLGLVQSPRKPVCDAAEIFCRNPIGNGSAPVIRRETLQAIIFLHPEHGYACWFDESFRQSEDIECWTRIVSRTAWTFACVPEALTLYRVNNGGLSANVDKQLATWTRFRDTVRGYNPMLEADYGSLAEAYQLRYLARRAIHGGQGRTGLALALRALRKNPRILVQEPGRTLVTLVAGAVACVLPMASVQRLTQGLGHVLQKSPVLRA